MTVCAGLVLWFVSLLNRAQILQSLVLIGVLRGTGGSSVAGSSRVGAAQCDATVGPSNANQPRTCEGLPPTLPLQPSLEHCRLLGQASAVTVDLLPSSPVTTHGTCPKVETRVQIRCVECRFAV